MAFLNGKKRSRLFAVTLLIVSMVTAFSLPFSVYATEDNPREPTTTGGTLTDNPGLVPTENPPAEPPIAPPTEDSSTDNPSDKPALEPVENPEQEVPAASELTIYVVEYETADGEKLLQDKVVADQMVGDEVREDAVVIEGYSVDESSKSITLAQNENLITFVYKTAEPAEEELPPVIEIPVIEEVVTEPAIVVEPTAATLTITHRLIVGDEYAEEIRVIDGLEVGQTLDLTEYLAPIDWVECITQEKSITLELAENTVVLEYVVSEGADVSVVLEDGNAVLEQDTNAEIKTDDEYANGIAQ